MQVIPEIPAETGALVYVIYDQLLDTFLLITIVSLLPEWKKYDSHFGKSHKILLNE